MLVNTSTARHKRVRVDAKISAKTGTSGDVPRKKNPRVPPRGRPYKSDQQADAFKGFVPSKRPALAGNHLLKRGREASLGGQCKGVDSPGKQNKYFDFPLRWAF